MNIEFGTRTEVDPDGNPKPGAEDRYAVSLIVLHTYKVTGSIARKPHIVSSILGREIQAAALRYDLKFFVVDKSGGADKPVGGIQGTMPVKDGVYILPPGGVSMSTVSSRNEPFSGQIAGKSENKNSKLSAKLFEYARVIRGKTVKVQSKNIDPLEFRALTLAPGPVADFPQTIVSGRFDYDYDTGNWLSSGFRFQYVKDGERRQDEVTGSVRWVEDPNRDVNGKGEYQFNLRFNEAGAREDESAFFAETSDEELFFAVDNEIPTLGGKITYQDTYGESAARDTERPVISSKITYDLQANRLTGEQIMNFFKLWLLIVGPVNDE